MTSAIDMIFEFISDIIDTLDSFTFDLYGFDVSIWSVILCFIVISFFASVWWKGAKG